MCRFLTSGFLLKIFVTFFCIYLQIGKCVSDRLSDTHGSGYIWCGVLRLFWCSPAPHRFTNAVFKCWWENWDIWAFGEFVCNFKVGKMFLEIDRIACQPSMRTHTFTNYRLYTVAYKWTLTWAVLMQPVAVDHFLNWKMDENTNYLCYNKKRDKTKKKFAMWPWQPQEQRGKWQAKGAVLLLKWYFQCWTFTCNGVFLYHNIAVCLRKRSELLLLLLLPFE